MCNFTTYSNDIFTISSETALRWISQDLLQDNIGSGNGMVPSGTKPLHAPLLSKLYDAIWRHKSAMGYIHS